LGEKVEYPSEDHEENNQDNPNELVFNERGADDRYSRNQEIKRLTKQKNVSSPRFLPKYVDIQLGISPFSLFKKYTIC